MSEWVVDYFKCVDSMSVELLEPLHADDVRLQFGNYPITTGKDGWRAGIGGFFGTIGGLSHSLDNVWEVDGRAIIESRIAYLLKDGTRVKLPCVTILTRRDGLVNNVQIFMDPTPLAGSPDA